MVELPKISPPFPSFLSRLTLDMFAVVTYWRPDASITGPARGRLFEEVLNRYCGCRALRLKERVGSRTVDGQVSASGFLHESDAVIVTPDVLVHLELKHLGGQLQKNDLLIFNQKGLDFLFAKNGLMRCRPFYRVIVSGSPLSEAARRFCINWGVCAVEPERLPLVTLYSFAFQRIRCEGISAALAQEIQREIPKLLAPLQVRTRHFARALSGSAHIIGTQRVERALVILQKVCGDRYRRAVERDAATSLRQRYKKLQRELRL